MLTNTQTHLNPHFPLSVGDEQPDSGQTWRSRRWQWVPATALPLLGSPITR
ncbi:hypothetical protein HanIR_Chr05g0225501 [Helianthus annuus]|nr:hypothetical protein HanIR_Chr05g0225501 [Helianthus annuus]